MTSHRVWRGLTLIWATVIAFLTLLPADNLPPLPPWELISADTAAHAAVFLALAFPLRLWWRAAGARHSLGGTFAVALTYGALIECLQLLMALGRHAEWTDVLSDGLGAMAGAALAGLWPRRW